MYKKKASAGNCIKAENGDVLIEPKDIQIQNRWDEYIEELHKDDRGEKPRISGEPEGPVILKCASGSSVKGYEEEEGCWSRQHRN